MQNDSKAGNTIKPSEQVCTIKETTGVTVFNKESYRVSISIDTVSTEMNRMKCFFDTDPGPNLSRESFHRNGWPKLTVPAHASNLKTATSNSVCVPSTITLHVMMSHGRVCVGFDAARTLAVYIIIVPMFIDRFAKDIFPADSKVVPCNSKLIPIMIFRMQTFKADQEDDKK